jgi:hypothetical protein
LTTDPKPRRLRRPILTLAGLALAGSTAFLTWWTTTLTGLPDVGDPFDLRAFERPIPDDTNAYILYRKAASLLPIEPDLPANYDWKTAPPVQREWANRSREALAIWRTGTLRPDAAYINPALINPETKLDVAQKLRSFVRLSLVEGSRLEDAGDLDGSLEWSLAVLRCSRHCGRRGTIIERLIGMAIHRRAATRLTRWAADPRVDAARLRRALGAAIAAQSATSPISDSLKVEYLGMLHSLADDALMVRLHDSQVVPNNQGGSTTVYGQGGWWSGVTRVGRRALHEPERSRRVIRMVFANWLAYADLPPSRRPPKVHGGTTNPTGPARTLLDDLYVVGDDAPGPARALPPETLAGWFASTMDARMGLPPFSAIENAFDRERSAQAALLVALANELYQREHGQFPGRVEDLVGPYLKALPEGDSPPK